MNAKAQSSALAGIQNLAKAITLSNEALFAAPERLEELRKECLNDLLAARAHFEAEFEELKEPGA